LFISSISGGSQVQFNLSPNQDSRSNALAAPQNLPTG